MNQELCNHRWVSNSGRGGAPEFRMNSMMSPFPLMHVKCSKCGCRGWMDQQQWQQTKEKNKDES